MKLSDIIKSLAVLSALLVSPGCRQAHGPEAIPVEEVPAAVSHAFDQAAPEVKNAANQVISSIQTKDEAKAFLELHVLASRPDLTPEQREAASRSILSLNERLRAAAEEGDNRAAEALQIYRSSK
jgi:hypothetical protein